MKKEKIPLLRWAGGKWRLLEQLINHLPLDIEQYIYNEPFIGAGSLFFYLKPNEANISDLNEHLINFYLSVREKPELVWNYFRSLSKGLDERKYYQVRSEYIQNRYSVKQAARFLFLNRTCFNGIFRVNKKGEFNVPYGKKAPPQNLKKGQLIEASKVLKLTNINILDFKVALANLNKGSFVYLDPPYPPLNGTSYFTHYTKERFQKRDQESLLNEVQGLDKRGVLFLLSTADINYTRKLYQGFNIKNLSVTRWVSSSSKKHKVSELLVSNYDFFHKE